MMSKSPMGMSSRPARAPAQMSATRAPMPMAPTKRAMPMAPSRGMYAKGGMVDGCCTKGKTKGKMY